MKAAMLTFEVKPGRTDELVGKVRALWGKIRDLPGLGPIYLVSEQGKDTCMTFGIWNTLEQSSSFLGNEDFIRFSEEIKPLLSSEPTRKVVDVLAVSEMIPKRVVVGDLSDPGKPVRELYDAINRRDLATFDRVVSEDLEYTEYGLNESVHGRESFKKYFQKWWEAFPEGSVEIRNLITVNDQVVVEVFGKGLQSGAFNLTGRSASPTNQMEDFHYCKVFRVRNGLIESGRSYSDSYKLLLSRAKEKKAA